VTALKASAAVFDAPITGRVGGPSLLVVTTHREWAKCRVTDAVAVRVTHRADQLHRHEERLSSLTVRVCAGFNRPTTIAAHGKVTIAHGNKLTDDRLMDAADAISAAVAGSTSVS